MVIRTYGCKSILVNRQDAKAPRVFEPPRRQDRQGDLNRKGAEAQRKSNAKYLYLLRNTLLTTLFRRRPDRSAERVERPEGSL